MGKNVGVAWEIETDIGDGLHIESSVVLYGFSIFIICTYSSSIVSFSHSIRKNMAWRYPERRPFKS